MILPHDANPGRIKFSEGTRSSRYTQGGTGKVRIDSSCEPAPVRARVQEPAPARGCAVPLRRTRPARDADLSGFGGTRQTQYVRSRPSRPRFAAGASHASILFTDKLDDWALMSSLAPFLGPGRFINSDAAAIREFARDVMGGISDEREAAVALYRAIRERVIYDPYVDLSSPSSYRASDVLAFGRGYCVGKASLLAAAARAIGLPARVGYADVRNHMTSPRLYELIKTDVFRWHSYADLYVEGRWVKATPAFNASLCNRLGVSVLEFDGRGDSLFQELDRSGRRHMEYLRDRGIFADVPFAEIVSDFRQHYPALMSNLGVSGDFQIEAIAGKAASHDRPVGSN
jgi:transglutaminase-like putative cysteine protease